MISPEVTVLALNAAVVSLAYFVVYPRLCGSNGWRIAINDLLATGTVLLVSGALYAGSDYEFNLLLIVTNWFWFTLLTYAAMETPLMIWYFNKHDAWKSFKS